MSLETNTALEVTTVEQPQKTINKEENMENPFGQSKAYYEILKCISKHEKQLELEICGGSLMSIITEHLKDLGYLTEDALKPGEMPETLD